MSEYKIDWRYINDPDAPDIDLSIDNLTSSLAQKAAQTDLNTTNTNVTANTQHASGTINIKSYSNLVTSNNWTAAINQAIADSPSGGTIKFPEGTYNHTGFTITKPINIIGCGKYSTFLTNTSTGNCITINANVERGSIRDISVRGNGTQIYGADATSGYGIVLNNNAVIWLFENVWFRGHGNHVIYSYGLGNINNINIINCEVEWSKADGVYISSKDNSNQINAIIIKHCNFSGLAGNGISLWGNNMVIDSNTIQSCNGYGINISSDLSVSYSSQGYKISGNYFEQCKNGFMLFKAAYNSPNATYLFGATIEDNYGNLLASQVNSGITDIVSFQNPNGYAGGAQIRRISFLNNSFTTDTLKIVNGNNILGTSSKVIVPVDASNLNTLYVNLGLAETQSLKSLVINGYFLAKGAVGYSTLTESDNITSSPSAINYPIALSGTNTIQAMSVYVDTNMTAYSIGLQLYARPKNSVNTHTLKYNGGTKALTSAGVATWATDTFVNLNGYEDAYLVLTVSSFSGGTTIKLGNPCIMYV